MAESVKKSVKEIFDAHSKTLKKHNHEETDSDSDLEPEQYHMEDAGLDILHCLICADIHENIKKLTS